MLGRCRMRRGVSLEVIVEEDDNAEVSFDPEPLLEEDQDEEDSEAGTTGSSTRSSSHRYEEEEDEDEDDDEDRDSEERDEEGILSSSSSSSPSAAVERRRKRDRRRTIGGGGGGLSRFRSVSCETLTLLDTSDMDSCCSEWDDTNELATSSNGNYVTLNRTISRRRIIQNIHSQCDSEDSGFEYYSNDDDHVLEDHSSNEDHSEELEDEEDEREKEGGEGEDTEAKEGHDRKDTGLIYETHDDEDDEMMIMDEHDESEENQINKQADGEEIKINTKSCEEQPQLQISQQTQTRKSIQPSKFAYKPKEALENDRIIIVETTTPVSNRSKQNTQDPAEEEMKLKREAYTIRNKEVRLAELPRPDTVKSVKQLFENLNTSVQHFRTWRDLGRFRDIKSNPSSKILRFDRNDGTESITNRSAFMSLTLPRLPSQGSFENVHQPSTKKLTSKGIKEVDKKETNGLRCPLNNQKNSTPGPQAKLTTQQGTKGEGQANKLKTKHNSNPKMAKMQTGSKVILRKPVVRGFNVKRALLENPRNFLPHDHSMSHQKEHSKSHHIINQSLSHIHKSTNHRETTDRSDTESLASDLSEDSGVSNDSLTLSSSSSTPPSSYRAFNAYASDPSFKLIDPSVMAKIRAVGTTVIFFGPRQRPKHEGGTLTRGSRPISSGLKIKKCSQSNQTEQKLLRSNHTAMASSNRLDKKNIPIPAPRIVGVLRKDSSSNSSDTNQSSNQTKSLPTPKTKKAHFDNVGPTISRYDEDTPIGKKGQWRTESDTVVYNFTKPQPPAVYF